MKIFGFNLSFRRKAAVGVTSDPQGALAPSGWRRILEPFAGAWQRNIEVDSPQTLLAFSAVYACLSLISADISKLRIKLVQQDADGIWNEFDSPAFSPVLRKPNRYQTRIQFMSNWMLMKLIYGNTYVLKERDARGVVVALYVLDSQRVNVLVTKDGAVFYRLRRDDLTGVVVDQVTIPASEIIHDRGPCLFHPLVGVPPLFACALAATQGNRIQSNSQQFFDNLSRPGGVLSAPGIIGDETIAQLKSEFEQNFSGANIGRLLVVGDDMKYTPMTIPAQQAQLIEQLQWTAVDVGRAFRVPLHKLATGPNPTFNNIGALNQDYYSQCLQEHIESIEILLDEGLGLTQVPSVVYGTELDLDGLNRMDPLSTAEVMEKGVKSGYLKPNEARAKFNLRPVPGGNTPYMQVQNTALEALSKVDPSAPAAQPATPTTPQGSQAPDAAPKAGDAEPPPASKAIEVISERMQRQLTEAEQAATQRMHDLEAMRALVDEARLVHEEQRRAAAELAAESQRIAEAKAEADATDAAFADFMATLTARLSTEDLCG